MESYESDLRNNLVPERLRNRFLMILVGFGFHFGGPNPSKIVQKNECFLASIWESIFDRFLMDFDDVFDVFLINIVTRFEKDDFTKISVSRTRNTHFQGFEASEFE